MTPPGYRCATCGEWHDELPFAYGADSPDYYAEIPEGEREHRARLSSDQCVVDDELFFVRALIQIPVAGAADPFEWGVWASLSKESYERAEELWTKPGREAEPPYFGWLATTLSPELYPPTLNLKTHVHTRPVGLRPVLELEPSEHPLAVEQRNGITVERVQEFAQVLLHETA